MKDFEPAELEVVTFDVDIVVASCLVVTCPANSCQCNKNMQCEGQQ